MSEQPSHTQTIEELLVETEGQIERAIKNLHKINQIAAQDVTILEQIAAFVAKIRHWLHHPEPAEDEFSDRGSYKYGSSMNAGLLEKVDAIAWAENMAKKDVIERAVRREIDLMEARRGEPYEVYPTHEIDED